MTATMAGTDRVPLRRSTRAYVVLTATVQPHAAGPLAIADPATRLAQYTEAAAHWRDAAARSDATLVVLENSGAAHDLGRATGLDVIACPPPSAEVAARGKGACEADLLRHGLRDIAERELGAPAWIVKATGRLWVTRAEMQIRRSRLSTADVVAEVDHARKWLDSRFFAADSRVLAELCGAAVDRCDDDAGTYLERVLYDLTHEAMVVERFASRPFLNGVSGSIGVPYGKGALRRLLRIAGPHLSLVHRRLTSGVS